MDNTKAKGKKTLDAIDHIAITVDSIDKAVKWYCENFKCSIAYQDETWAKIEFANISLALVVAEQHPGHIGFLVENAQRFGELKTHRDGTKSVYIQDPAGNAVEIMNDDKLSLNQ